ncbi:MAG: efflux transporter outer membrane subunit [Candidimonas sp.]
MTYRNLRLSVPALMLTVALAGCSLAPKYERPAAPVPDRFPGQESAASQPEPSASHGADLGWQDFFRDERLKSLIQIALDNNRDMRIAVQRIEEARAQYGVARSEQFPTIGVGGSGQATRYPPPLRQGGENSPSVARIYQAGVGLTAFELDFFGRVRNLSEAAFQQFLATEQARQTVHINLVAQVAEAYFRLLAAQQTEHLIEQTVASRENTLKIVQSRYDVGVVSALDLNQARSQLNTVRADLAAIKRAQAQALNALHLVLGAEIPAGLSEPAVFGRDQLMSGIPVGLPSDLLQRRPDIRAAEHGLLAANANIGAARAAFFPNISITGMLGFASTQLGGLFSSGNRFWQFSPQVQMPIFSGGVTGNLALAEARSNIAVSTYEKTIQVAFREVADALAGEETYSGQLDALRDMEQSSAETLKLAQLRYETGVDSFLQVQNAEVDLYTTQRAFLQTGLDSLLNRVELYKALGGGWLEHSQAQQGEAQG